MKQSKKIIGIVSIVALIVVIIGSIYALSRPQKMAQQETKKASTVQSSLKVSEKKVESKVSKPSTSSLTSESTLQASKIEQSTAQSETQNSKADLKAFNQKATAEEVYVKYPYGRTMNFERATDEKLKALEKEYTLKEMTNLRDDYDGLTKSVIIFE